MSDRQGPTPRGGMEPEDMSTLIRPYVLTSGRAREKSVALDMITVVATALELSEDVFLEPEQRRVLELCRTPSSVAEVAAHLSLPIAVVKVLIADLAERRHVYTQTPPAPDSRSKRRDLLEAVLDGIQRL
jgi:hypothetical protein